MFTSQLGITNDEKGEVGKDMDKVFWRNIMSNKYMKNK